MPCASTGRPRSTSFSVTWSRSPGLRLHLLAAQRAAGALAGGLALAPHRPTVDETVLDTGGRRGRRFEGGTVRDGFGIEHSDVGIGAGCEDAAAAEAEAGRRQAGHPPHCFFEPEELELAAVMAEDALEGAPQPRRMPLCVTAPANASAISVTFPRPISPRYRTLLRCSDGEDPSSAVQLQVGRVRGGTTIAGQPAAPICGQQRAPDRPGNSNSPAARTRAVLPASSEAGRASRQSGRRSGNFGSNGRGVQTDCPSWKSRRVEIPSGSDKLVIEYRPETVNCGIGLDASCDIARRLSSGHGFNQNAPDQLAFIFDPQTKNASQGLADIGVAHGCLVAKTRLEVRTSGSHEVHRISPAETAVHPLPLLKAGIGNLHRAEQGLFAAGREGAEIDRNRWNRRQRRTFQVDGGQWQCTGELAKRIINKETAYIILGQ